MSGMNWRYVFSITVKELVYRKWMATWKYS